MVLSRIFGKRELKEGQLTKREKQEALRLNPGMFDSLDRAIDIYRKAPILPESVMKRKEKFESIKKESKGKRKSERKRILDVHSNEKYFLSSQSADIIFCLYTNRAPDKNL